MQDTTTMDCVVLPRSKNESQPIIRHDTFRYNEYEHTNLCPDLLSHPSTRLVFLHGESICYIHFRILVFLDYLACIKVQRKEL